MFFFYQKNDVCYNNIQLILEREVRTLIVGHK